MKVNVEIKNQRRVMRDIENDFQKMKRELLDELDKIGDRMLDDTRRYSPVDTGYLRDSYTKEDLRNGFLVGTDAYYAPFVEFGTRNMASQEHLGKAYRDAVDEFENRSDDVMDKYTR